MIEAGRILLYIGACILAVFAGIYAFVLAAFWLTEGACWIAACSG